MTRRALVLGAPFGLACRPAAAERFAARLDAFRRADKSSPSPAGALLFVGSSTIRLWPSLASSFAPRPVVQRGFGGATLREVVAHSALLFGPHRPDAIVLYAGENDIAEGASPRRVVSHYLDLRDALRSMPAGRAPVVFIELKPTWARWSRWPAMRAVNRAIATLAEQDRPAALVATSRFVLTPSGEPDATMFLDDGLHFNAAGYAALTVAVADALTTISG